MWRHKPFHCLEMYFCLYFIRMCVIRMENLIDWNTALWLTDAACFCLLTHQNFLSSFFNPNFSIAYAEAVLDRIKINVLRKRFNLHYFRRTLFIALRVFRHFLLTELNILTLFQEVLHSAAFLHAFIFSKSRAWELALRFVQGPGVACWIKTYRSLYIYLYVYFCRFLFRVPSLAQGCWSSLHQVDQIMMWTPCG